jgi:hypothetical protein
VHVSNKVLAALVLIAATAGGFLGLLYKSSISTGTEAVTAGASQSAATAGTVQTLPLVQYLTAVVSVHAILLSLAGLLAVNGLGKLSETAKHKWDKTNIRKKRTIENAMLKLAGGGAVSENMLGNAPDNNIVSLTERNWTVGAIGIVYSLLGNALSARIEAMPLFLGEFNLPGLMAFISLLLVGYQLVLFFSLSNLCMNTLLTYPRTA